MEPITLHAVGRFRGQPIATATPRPDCLILRVEDSRDDAFWLEIHLTRADLEAMLAAYIDPPVTETCGQWVTIHEDGGTTSERCRRQRGHSGRCEGITIH